MKKCYTGVGSRKTPKLILDFFEKIATRLAIVGYTLRSGGSEGADKAFEAGCVKGIGSKEIYLPWPGFEENKTQHSRPTAEAMKIAEQNHPNWPNCSPGARLLLGRNTHQVLGADCSTPSLFVICWTHPRKGGTTQTLRVAQRFGIPIANLHTMKNFDMDTWLSQFR